MVIAIIILAVLAVLSVAYLLLIRPRPEPKTSLEPLKRDYAHRGLHGDFAVENTMTAFRAADREGYGIELDLHLSSDGVVVVFHDDTLERMCGKAEAVESKTASELSWTPLSGTYEKIPLFADVLSAIDPKTPLLIELKGKNTRLCEEVARMLDKYDGYFAIHSFNPILLNWFRINRPRYLRGQLVTNMFKSKNKENIFIKCILSLMLTNCISKPDFISYDVNDANNLSVLICQKLYHTPMFAWTITTPEKYGEVKAKGHIAIFEQFEPKSSQRR
jgi:glycerophosphoryl diester phosphodiesterase